MALPAALGTSALLAGLGPGPVVGAFILVGLLMLLFYLWREQVALVSGAGAAPAVHHSTVARIAWILCFKAGSGLT